MTMVSNKAYGIFLNPWVGIPKPPPEPPWIDALPSAEEGYVVARKSQKVKS
jgi:hypothetical protein